MLLCEWSRLFKMLEPLIRFGALCTAFYLLSSEVQASVTNKSNSAVKTEFLRTEMDGVSKETWKRHVPAEHINGALARQLLRCQLDKASDTVALIPAFSKI